MSAFNLNTHMTEGEAFEFRRMAQAYADRQIEALKLYHRETIDEVIQRLIERQREPQEGEPAAAK